MPWDLIRLGVKYPVSCEAQRTVPHLHLSGGL